VSEWIDVSRRAGFALHRLVGWIFWDPAGIANYEALGVPNGSGYYIATRAAPLAAAGDDAVIAAFYSIHSGFVRVSLNLCREHTTFAAAADARDRAVRAGLRNHVPGICDELAALRQPLWDAADSLSPAGRVLFAAHRSWPRPDDPLTSAWLAANTIREWRGDTHWAIHCSEGISGPAAGVLDGAWRNYEDPEWLPRSRGAGDDDIAAAVEALGGRGLITDGRVNAAGIAYRQSLEDRLDRLTVAPWQYLGRETCERLLSLLDAAGPTLMARVDETAGRNWMPAGRDRPVARTPTK
jgi:Helix-turn-helix family